MNSTPRSREFADALVTLFAGEDMDTRTTTLLVAHATGDDVIVLYREHPDGPVLGRRYDIEESMSQSGHYYSPTGLAGNALDEDILDPTGHGGLLDVDWADGLIDNPREVEWVGFGEAPHEPRDEHPDPPGTTYDGSYSPPT